jgi:hypothetical protein
MTLGEFRAWLEGFEESFEKDALSADKWAKIKAKLATVNVIAPAAPTPPWPTPTKMPPLPKWDVSLAPRSIAL